MLKIQHMAKVDDGLTRREREVMNILFRRGEAKVSEVMADMEEPPTYSAVRSILRILAGKKLITHREDGPRYVYLPTADPEQVRTGALKELVRTFFSNSASSAVAAMLGEYGDRLSGEDLDRIERLIEQMRDRGGRP